MEAIVIVGAVALGLAATLVVILLGNPRRHTLFQAEPRSSALPKRRKNKGAPRHQRGRPQT